MIDPLKRIFSAPSTARADIDLEGILRILGQQLYHYARLIAGSKEGAEDAVQDLLVAVLEHRERIENPRAWLFTVLRRKAMAYRKASQKHIGLSEENLREAFETDASTLLVLQDSFKAMDPVVREIVLLRFWEGLTYAETAKVIGLPQGTVQSLCHRGLKELRERFGEERLEHEEGAHEQIVATNPG